MPIACGGEARAGDQLGTVWVMQDRIAEPTRGDAMVSTLHTSLGTQQVVRRFECPG